MEQLQSSPIELIASQDQSEPYEMERKHCFKLEDGRYIVAWTTTPWTLPSNSAIAVNKSIKYVEIEYENQVLIMAESRVEKVMTDEKHQPLEYKVLNKINYHSPPINCHSNIRYFSRYAFWLK